MSSVDDLSCAGSPWWRPYPDASFAQRKTGGFTIAAHGPLDAPAQDKPNVFLVHGMVDASETWTPLLPALSGCNVWRLDLPWSGRDGVSWPGHAPALAWLREALALCPAKDGLYIGHSFGAAVLLEWLATDPAAPASVGAALLLSPFYCSQQRKIVWDDIDQYARYLPLYFEQALRTRMGAATPEDAVLRAMAHKLGERLLPDALLELFRVFLASRRWSLDQLHMPLRVVIGDRDDPLVRDSAQALAAAVPGIELHTLASCGHYSMHEQPDAVRSLVAALLHAMPAAPREAA